MNEPILPEGWVRGRGYSHAIRSGDDLFVAGVLPTASIDQAIAQTFVEQWARVLENLGTILTAAEMDYDDVTSLRIYVTSLSLYNASGSALAEAWKTTFGSYFPAVTLVEVAKLVEPDAIVEIEAHARRAV